KGSGRSSSGVVFGVRIGSRTAFRPSRTLRRLSDFLTSSRRSSPGFVGWEAPGNRLLTRTICSLKARNPDPRSACPEGRLVRHRPFGALTLPGNAPNLPFRLRRREEVGPIKAAATDAFGSVTRGTTLHHG